MGSTVPLQQRNQAWAPMRSLSRSLIVGLRDWFRPNCTLFLIAAVIFLAASCSGAPGATGEKKDKNEKKDEPILHPVGFSLRQFPAPEDYNWRGSDSHTLDGIIWYPSVNGANEKEQFIGPPDAPLFYAGRAAKDSVLAPAFSKFPVIAL